MTTVLIAKAVLKMPNKVGDKIIRVQKIQQQLTGNSYIPNGWIAGTLTQAQFNADVQNWVGAEQAEQAHQNGAVAQRDAAYLRIQVDLQLIMALVQAKANANAAVAEAVIESAGFYVKPNSGSRKRENAVYNTDLPGTIIATADSSGPHEWEMSRDRVNLVYLPATTGGKTTISNLAVGAAKITAQSPERYRQA